jgi:hypothetical protein
MNTPIIAGLDLSGVTRAGWASTGFFGSLAILEPDQRMGYDQTRAGYMMVGEITSFNGAADRIGDSRVEVDGGHRRPAAAQISAERSARSGAEQKCE